MPKIGYRKLTDEEVEEYLKKQGYVEELPLDLQPKKKKAERVIESDKNNQPEQNTDQVAG